FFWRLASWTWSLFSIIFVRNCWTNSSEAGASWRVWYRYAVMASWSSPRVIASLLTTATTRSVTSSSLGFAAAPGPGGRASFGASGASTAATIGWGLGSSLVLPSHGIHDGAAQPPSASASSQAAAGQRITGGRAPRGGAAARRGPAPTHPAPRPPRL